MRSQKPFEKDPVKYDGTPDKPAAPHTWKRIDPDINKIADRIRMASRTKEQSGKSFADREDHKELSSRGGKTTAAKRSKP